MPVGKETAGATERIIGEWMQDKDRASLVIATKVAGPSSRPFLLQQREIELHGPAPDPSEQLCHSPAQLARACDASLSRLRTTYIDLYQLHWPDRPTPLWGASVFTQALAKGVYSMRAVDTAPSQGRPFEEICSGVKALLDAGKIRAWGLSNETAYGVTMFCETARRLGMALPVSVQNDFSLLDRRFETETLEACHHYGVALLPYGPLCGGTLADKYGASRDGHKTAKLQLGRHVEFADFQARYHAPPSLQASRRYADAARKHGLTPVELALGWCASRWYVASTIIGCTTVEHLREDFAACGKRLSAEVEALVEGIHRANKNPNADHEGAALL